MIQQLLVWIIVGAAAGYAIRTIMRGMRDSGDHCGNCGLDEHRQGSRDKR